MAKPHRPELKDNEGNHQLLLELHVLGHVVDIGNNSDFTTIRLNTRDIL
jgi:hypothetical protein